MKNRKTKSEKREQKKKINMSVSGKSVFVIKNILDRKDDKKGRNDKNT